MVRTKFEILDANDCKTIPIIENFSNENEDLQNLWNNKEEKMKEENVEILIKDTPSVQINKNHSKDPNKWYEILDRTSFCPEREDKKKYQEYWRNPIFFLKEVFNWVSQRILPCYDEKLNRARKTCDYHKIKLNMFRPMVENLARFQISWQELEMLYHYKKALQNFGPKTLAFCSWNWIGKTRISAFIMFHFVTCYYRAKVIYIAPRNEMAMEAKELVKTLFNISYKYGRRSKENRNTIYFWDGGFWDSSIKFVSSKIGFQWIHADNFLVVADEAADLSDDILKSVNWLQWRWNNIFIMLWNPRYDTWFFHDTCCLKSEHIAVINFDAEQSPLIERGYIQKAKDLYWEHSDEYIRRIKWWYPRKKDSSIATDLLEWGVKKE